MAQKQSSSESPHQLRHLVLSDYERLNTRFFATQISLHQLSGVREGNFLLELDDENIRFWSECMSDDLIVMLCTSEHILVACRIVSKFLVMANNPAESSVRRIVINVEICGETNIERVPWNLLVALVGRFPSMSHASFAEIWKLCRATGWLSTASGDDLILTKGRFEVRFASSRSDLEFIASIAGYHPFGSATAPIMLVASAAGKRVGSLLGDFSRNSTRSHAAPWRVFRDQYAIIRRNAMRYVRLYDDPSAKAKFHIHDVLAEAYEYISPSLLVEPISIIESISYDYHPVAPKRNYNIEPPARVDRSFYYWKPYYLPMVDSQTPAERDAVTRRVHEILSVRGKRRYVMAPGAEEDIAFAIEKKAWAVRYSPANTGLWHLLDKGDVVLLKDRSDRIRGYGIVGGTKKYRMKGREDFPLWIDFSETVGGAKVDVSEHVASLWYKRLRRGGLVEIPEELGALAKQEVYDQKMEGKMWVQPNPYLLHRTTFDVRHSQIFVVQGFELSTTVLPVIKEILLGHGYSVKFSGDRRGQVIFEDIWLMLNESEVVIVDFTKRRPNVYLEFGMALVLGKPIIAITQDRDDLPSDTPELKYILYSDRLGDKTLAVALPDAIRDTIEDIHRARRSVGGIEEAATF